MPARTWVPLAAVAPGGLVIATPPKLVAVAAALLFASSLAISVVETDPIQAAPPADSPPISLIGDSTMSAMEWYQYDDDDADTLANNDIRAIVGNSYDMTFAAESCRRIVTTSCQGRFGTRPVSVLPLIQTTLKGSLGEAMVVMAGYDDASIGSGIDQVVAAAQSQGVQRVYWLTYQQDTTYRLPGGMAASSLYAANNAELLAAAARNPALRLVDWDHYSDGRPGWFTYDGIHLNPIGAVGLAQFIKSTLDADTSLGRCRASAALTGTTEAATSSVQQPAIDRAGFVASAPVRVLDTRDPSLGGKAGKLGANRTLTIDLADEVPDDAEAVALSVTAVDSCRAGYLTAFACGSRPPTSNVNYEVGRTTAGMVIAAMTGDTVCVYSSAATDVVVDVTGAFTPGGAPFHPIAPRRWVDTRGGDSLSTDVVGARTSSNDTPVMLRGVGGVPADATAVWLNLTVADPRVSTVLAAYPGPCGSPNPASTVNARPLRSAASAALVGIGSDGTVCVRTTNGLSDVVVDVAGWFGGGGGGLLYVSQQPVRLLDTRISPGSAQTDQRVVIDGVSVLNITAVDSTGAGFVSVRPCGTSAISSVLNMSAGEDTANLVAASSDLSGATCISSNAATHLVVDRLGAFVP